MNFPKLLLIVLVATQASQSSGGPVEELFNISETPWYWGDRSANFGYMDLSKFPWVHSVCLDWLYVEESSTRENLHLWHAELGWIFTTSDTFPKAYLYLSNEWVLIDLTNAAEVKYFSFASNKWSSLKMIQEYQKIPYELRGIRATDHLYRPTYISIGQYLMIREMYTFSGTDSNTYAYDEDSDEFYPITRHYTSFGGIGIPNNFNIKLTVTDDILKAETISGWTGEVYATDEYDIIER